MPDEKQIKKWSFKNNRLKCNKLTDESDRFQDVFEGRIALYLHGEKDHRLVRVIEVGSVLNRPDYHPGSVLCLVQELTTGEFRETALHWLRFSEEYDNVR